MITPINSEIKFVEVEIGKGKVQRVTAPSHIRAAVTKMNGREILTSNLYYDINNEEPYVADEKYVLREFKKNEPELFDKAVGKLIEAGIINRATERFNLVTYAGALNILKVYDIEPASLLKGGEKVPMVQKGLFNNQVTMTSPADDIQSKVNKLFPPESTGIFKARRTPRTGGSRVRLSEPGITIGDKDSFSLLNLSKHMMPLVYKIPYVQQAVDKHVQTALYADIAIQEIEGELLLGIKFHEIGQYRIEIKRNNALEIPLNNLSVTQKTNSFQSLLKLFKKHSLLNTYHTEPQIAGDTVLFTIKRGADNGKSNEQENKTR